MEERVRGEGVRHGSREKEVVDLAKPSAAPPGGVEEEELDPRVQQELEKLNNCTDEINRLEIQLDDANTVFRSLLSDSTHHLKALSKRIGSHIEKARPYYETLELTVKAQADCQKAAVEFQRAAGVHAAAKETISLAEERFADNSGEWKFDNAWQEMLNHATIKVMDAEKKRTASEKEHLSKSAAFTEIEAKVKTLEKKLSRHIEKSKPYFEGKDVFNKALEAEKARVQQLQVRIAAAKSDYARSLRNLEDISESIHHRRKLTQQARDGAQYDSLAYDLDTVHLGEEANDAASLVSDSTGRDSALGSTSIAGVEEDEEVEGAGALVDKVTRSFSLPEQLGALGGRVTSRSGGEGGKWEEDEVASITEAESIRL